MRITKIKVKNFKSFDNVEIDLGKFNVLIGANSSGKSNFVSIFKFLKDIMNHGLENAISMQGGIDYIRNLNISTSIPLSIELYGYIDPEIPLSLGKSIFARFKEFTYKFTIRFYKTTRKYVIQEENFESKCNMVKIKEKKDSKKQKVEKKIGEAKFIVSRKHNKVIYKLEATPKELENLIPKAYLGIRHDPLHPHEMDSMKLVLEERPMMPPFYLFGMFLERIQVYDFYPRLTKEAGLITGKTELEPDGSNLALVLKNIMQDEKDRQKIFILIKDLLPFIEDITVEKFADKFLIPFVKESYMHACSSSAIF